MRMHDNPTLVLAFRSRSSTVRKVQQAGCLAVLEMLDFSPEQAGMIGDRYITDVLEGNRLGIHIILVCRPPSSE